MPKLIIESEYWEDMPEAFKVFWETPEDAPAGMFWGTRRGDTIVLVGDDGPDLYIVRSKRASK